MIAMDKENMSFVKDFWNKGKQDFSEIFNAPDMNRLFEMPEMKDDEYLKEEKLLFQAVALFVVADANRSNEEKNINEVLTLLEKNNTIDLDIMFADLEKTHPARSKWESFTYAVLDDKRKRKAKANLIIRLELF